MRLGFILAAALLSSPTVLAQPFGISTDQFETSDFSIQLLEQDHDVVPIEKEHGWLVVNTQVDTPYVLRLTNTTSERIMVVISLNGKDPFTGERAMLGTRGQVIDPGKSLEIDTAKARKKQPTTPLLLDPTREFGVIHVISFRERMDYPHLLPWSDALSRRVGGSVRIGPGGKSDLQWVPPSGAPFRKMSQDPASRVHIEYGERNSVSSRNRR